MVYMFIHKDPKDPKNPKDNNPPDAVDDVVGKVSGHQVSEIASSTILSNDSDPDGDAINIQSIQNTSKFGATITFVNGVIQYDPTTSTQIQNLASGEKLTDEVTYTIVDEHGNTDTATIFYTVYSPKDKDNNPPDALDDTAGTVSGSATNDLSAAVILQNDSDPDGDTITITDVDATSALGASVILVDSNNDGVADSVRYDPSTSTQIQNLPAGQTLTDTITYTISDGKGGTDTATISYIVKSPKDVDPDNNPPVAVNDDAGTVLINTTTSTSSTDILSNDSDPDAGDTITIQSVATTSALGASVTFQNGQVVYDPTSSTNIQSIVSNLPVGQFITDTVEYTIVDESGATDTALISYRIEGTNDGVQNDPDALSDDLGKLKPSETSTQSFATILANDTDVDGDVINVTAVDATSTLGATVSLIDTDNDGVPDSVQYDPSSSTTIQNLGLGETITDTVVYTITDETGRTDQATLFYTVHNPDPNGNKNDPDALSDDLGDVVKTDTKDTDFSVILANDTDIDGDVINVTAVEGTSTLGATVTLVDTDNDGQPDAVRYDPSTSTTIQNLQPGESLTDSVVYTITDEDGNTDQATLFYSVNGGNVDQNTVDAVDDNGGALLNSQTDTTTVAEILSNDSDAEGDTFSLQSIDSTSSLGATVTLVNGVVTYDPSTSTVLQNLAVGETRTDTVTYTIVDARGATDTATISYTVSGSNGGNGNNPPIAVDDIGGTDIPTDSALTITSTFVLSNDTDVDQNDDPVIQSVATTSALGATVTFVNGEISYDPTAAANIQAIVANLPVGQFFTDTVEYTIVDGSGATDTAFIRYTIQGQNTNGGNGNPPIANDDDRGTVVANATTSTSSTIILSNDTDIDGDTVTIQSVANTSSLGASVTFANGEVVYDPTTSANIQTIVSTLPAGQSITDTVEYTITDGNGNTDTAVISYTIFGTNAGDNPPTALSDDLGKLKPDETSTTGFSTILANDTDVDGDTINVTAVNSTSTLGATVTLVDTNNDGVPDSVKYDPSTSTTIQNLQPGQTVTDTVIYTITDENGNTDQATLFYTVHEPLTGVKNDPDALSDDLGDVVKDQSKDTGFATILANDTDIDGDAINVTAVEPTSTLGATVTLVDTNNDGVVDSVRYNPSTSTTIQNLQPGESVTDSVVYTITDEDGNTDQATLFYTVNGGTVANGNPPDAVDDNAGTLLASETLQITSTTILSNDTDVDGDTISITTVDGTSTLGATVTFVNGVVTYDPSSSQTLQNLPVGQSVTDTITYTITDGNGNFDTATISYTVNGTNTGGNNSVIAVDDFVGLVEGDQTTPTNVATILANDNDPQGDTFSVTNVDNTSALGATVTFVNGVVTYDPASSTTIQNLPAGEVLVDTITYTITDSKGAQDTATIRYVVKSPNGDNRPPDAIDDNQGVVRIDQTKTTTAATILSNDSDPDNDTLTITSIDNTSALGASVTFVNGEVVYDPTSAPAIQQLPLGTTVTDTVSYTISDGNGGFDTATISYTITGTYVTPAGNDPDALSDDLGKLKPDETSTTDFSTILANDTDIDGDAINVTAVQPTSTLGATVTLVDTNNDGVPDSVKYDPSTSTTIQNLQPGQTVTDTVVYTITDETGRTDQATLFYTVHEPDDGVKNDPDALSDDLGDVVKSDTKDTGFAVILANDTDIDGDAINVTAVEPTSNLGATVTLVDTNNDGVLDSVRYDPSTSTTIQNLQPGESITDSVVYTITDEDGNTDQATLFYSVNGGNVDQNTVDAVDDNGGALLANATDTTTVAEILSNDSDPDGDAFSLQSIDGTSLLGATVTLVNGVVTYDPSTSQTIQNLPAGQTITDSVTYTIIDDRGATDTATITYTVTGTATGGGNNPPDAINDSLGATPIDQTTTETISEILTNDSDPDGDALAVTQIDPTSSLGAAITPVLTNGVITGFTYDPTGSAAIQNLPQGVTVQDTFSYTITDGNGGFDTATISYTITGTKVDGQNTVDAVDDNAGQVFSNSTDTITVAEILLNDTDAEGDTFALQSIDSTSAQGATVTLVNGVITYDPSTSQAIQNLAPGAVLTDTVSYTIIDDRGATDTATITYTVVGRDDNQQGNDPDALSDDLGMLEKDGMKTTDFATILANDTDVDGDAINVTAVEPTSTLGATVTLVDTDNDGVPDSVKYDPSTSTTIQNLQPGESITDSVVYTITDEDGNTDQATLFYTVKEPVDGGSNPPDAINDNLGVVPLDATTTTSAATILANDSDPDGDALTITNVDGTSSLGATVTFVNGEVVYDPTSSAVIQSLPVGTTVTDTVTYTITDGNGGFDTATISYVIQGGNTGGNGSVDAVDDFLGLVSGDQTTTTDVSTILANDSDPENDPISVTNIDATSSLGSTISFIDTDNDGQVDQFVYDPSSSTQVLNLPAGEVLIDTITYTVTDGNGNFDTATVRYVVQSPNVDPGKNPPDAISDDLGEVSKDDQKVTDFGTILANDTDIDGDAINVTAVAPTSNLGATVTLVDTDNDGVPDSVSYDPSTSTTIQNLAPGESVTDSVIYTITDADGNTDQATLFYTVNGDTVGQGTPPDAVDDDQGTVPGDDTTTTTVADILGNDSDPDGDPISVTNIDATSELGATITFVDTDGDGLVDEFTYDPSTSQTIQDLPAGETITDTITYTITDGKDGSDTATITYTVSSPNVVDNTPPEAEKDDLGEVPGDETTTTTFTEILSNDSDADGDDLTVIDIDGTSEFGATITPVDTDNDGVYDSFTYDPSTSQTIQDLPAGECLTDTITYTISDGNGGTDTATICYTVMSPNEPENSVVAEDDHIDVTVSNDETAEGSTSILLANDYDPEGDSFTITSSDATSSLGASVSLVDSNGDGVFDKISYDPTTSDQLSDLNYGECVTDSFTYTITDENGASDTATVFLTVEGSYQGGGGCKVVDTSCWGGSWGSWKDLFNKDFVNEGTTDGMDWKDAFDVMGCDTGRNDDRRDDMRDYGKDIYDDAKDCVDDGHFDHHQNQNDDC